MGNKFAGENLGWRRITTNSDSSHSANTNAKVKKKSIKEAKITAKIKTERIINIKRESM